MIYAGVNGYLDALPVAKVRGFEDGLLSLLRGKNVDILNTIRDSRDLSDDTAAKLKAVVEGLRQDFCLIDRLLDLPSWPGTRPGMTKEGLAVGSRIGSPG